ncbi:Ferric-chelate reductase 1 [Nesidiocoris tenuis]|uniref:Ferric-chelate reductase 1 n=1 Tax=Nesidiocoris tenuis TaxID=355587 RepID=A0ABN7BA45_9HEMI|nr:Ferric-chelate reductase 1 [Nesidiocoris tenuis]
MVKWTVFLFLVGLVGTTLSFPVDNSSEESSEDSKEVAPPEDPAPGFQYPETTETQPEPSPEPGKHPDVPLNDICETMKIGHEAKPENNEQSPYTIILSTDEVKPGRTIAVTISGKSKQTPFRGLIVQGRCDGKPVGSFVGGSVGPLKYYDCAGGFKNAIVYIDMEEKDVNEATLEWTAPATECSVDFYVSTVKTYDEFWEKQKSEYPLKVVAQN